MWTEGRITVGSWPNLADGHIDVLHGAVTAVIKIRRAIVEYCHMLFCLDACLQVTTHK